MQIVESMTPGYARYALSQKITVDGLCTRFLTSKQLHEMMKENSSSLQPFHVADYGAADCRNSQDFYKSLLEASKRTGRDLKISIVDLPGNDWETALRSCEEVGLTKNQVEFIKNSFFKQVLPEGSVDLGFSCMASHWLSKEVVNKYGLSLEKSCSAHTKFTTEDERKLYQAASREDGLNFLISRSKELKPGSGRIIVGSSTVTQSKFSPGENVFTYKAVFEDLSLIFAGCGKQITLPVYLRSESEWMDLFSSPEMERRRLKLVSHEVEVLENPYYQRVLHGEESDRDCWSETKAGKFAEDYVKSVLAWSQNIFITVFGADRRGQMEMEKCIEELRRRVARNPERYRHDYCISIMEIHSS